MSQFEKIIASIIIIIIFGTINYIGVERASFYNKFSTLIKTLGITIFTVAGLAMFEGDFLKLSETASVTENLGTIGNIVAALMLILFSYLGWDRVGYIAGEMKEPQKVIPKTMFYGISTIAILYISANILYHTVLGMEGVRSSSIVASDIATLLFGNLGASLMSITVIISATGSINGTMMSASRLYYAMARDGMLFKWFDNIHPRFRTPSNAIVAHCIWGIVLLVIRQNFETIVTGMVFTILIFYTFTTVAFFKFRKLDLGESGYRIPFYPFLPSIYLIGLASLVLLRIYYQFNLSIQDLSFVLTGVPAYFIFFKNNKILLEK